MSKNRKGKLSFASVHDANDVVNDLAVGQVVYIVGLPHRVIRVMGQKVFAVVSGGEDFNWYARPDDGRKYVSTHARGKRGVGVL